jgi:tetratricopeptide (TPR) repeat protein
MNHTTGNSIRHLRLIALGCLAALVAAPGCRMVSHEQNAAGVRDFNQGQYQLAIQKFQHAVANNPTNADSYYNLAATYHRLGKLNHTQPELDQAENYYNQCLDHDPNHRDCHRSLAVLLAEENRTESAFTLLEKWAAENPSSSAPQVELARLSQEFGKQDAAHNYLLAAVQINPYDPQALAALGQFHEQNGDSAQALANYQRSLGQDNFQSGVAARVAALQHYSGAATTTPPPGASSPLIVTPPGGTRTVSSPTQTQRY